MDSKMTVKNPDYLTAFKMVRASEIVYHEALHAIHKLATSKKYRNEDKIRIIEALSMSGIDRGRAEHSLMAESVPYKGKIKNNAIEKDTKTVATSPDKKYFTEKEIARMKENKQKMIDSIEDLWNDLYETTLEYRKAKGI